MNPPVPAPIPTPSPTPSPTPGGKRRAPISSLRGVLRRTHLLLALGAVGFVSLVLAVPALLTLHFYAEHDLRLLGRAIANTVEAAVVFEDAEATQEALAAIVDDEDVAEAAVHARNGQRLAIWRNSRTGWRARVASTAVRLLNDRPIVVPVMHDGAVVGQVEVQGGGRTLLQFLGLGVLGILGGQVLIALGALFLSNRILGQIVQPLRALAEVAARVQRERAFGERVPESGIKELNDLGHAFNALLSELDDWHTTMEGENRRLSHQASHDSLTGLPNRAFFEGRLNRALVDAQASNARVAVMLIDCDKFKDINDRYGHAAGDAVLAGIAARLKGQFRERDLVARLGGDEFAVLIAPSQATADLHRLAETASQAVRIPLLVRDGLALTCGLSVGLAIYPDDAANAADLLHRADEAMYRAKRGRGTDVEETR